MLFLLLWVVVCTPLFIYYLWVSSFPRVDCGPKLTTLNKDQINLKGKTVEKLGLIGKEKAIACEAIISITKYD